MSGTSPPRPHADRFDLSPKSEASEPEKLKRARLGRLKVYEHIRQTHEHYWKCFNWERLLKLSRTNSDNVGGPLNRVGNANNVGQYHSSNLSLSNSGNSESPPLNNNRSEGQDLRTLGPWSEPDSDDSPQLFSGYSPLMHQVLDPSVVQFLNFFHLPQNTRGTNLGYAFVHFRDKQVAHRFKEIFNGIKFTHSRDPGGRGGSPESQTQTTKILEIQETSADMIPYWRGIFLQQQRRRNMFWFDDESFEKYYE